MCIRDRNLLAPGTSFSWYRKRERDFLQYFSQEDELIFCNDITGLLSMFIVNYGVKEWRLFIDSSKQSLKAVLLHNGNKFASVPVAHSVYLKERYENLSMILSKLKYKDHEWTIYMEI